MVLLFKLSTLAASLFLPVGKGPAVVCIVKTIAGLGEIFYFFPRDPFSVSTLSHFFPLPFLHLRAGNHG